MTLHASEPEVAIKDTEVFIVRGTGYPSADQAQQQGEAWWDYVMVGFARQRIGADFGVRAPLQGGMTEAGFGIMRAAMEAERHGPVQFFNERSGVQVYATEPPAYFWHGHARGVVGRAGEGVLDAIQAAHAADARMSASDRLAYGLYAASFSDLPVDARFLMLSMALETMITQEPRSSAAKAVLDELIDITRVSELDDHERRSIVGGLKEMHRRESVNQAGKRLAETLGENTYGGRTPSRFFSFIYQLRSDLVHGAYPRPDDQLIGIEASRLQQFVSDLLARSLGT